MQQDRATATFVGITDKDFSRLKTFIYKECGIKITDAKRTMVEARLQKRLRRLNLASFSDYSDYLFSPRGMEQELSEMINVITTNKTDFFREPIHFTHLAKEVVPHLARSKNTITVWSAGCSSGEEAYTLAMVLEECGCNFSILATDISTSVLDAARLAVYDEERISPVPESLRKRYLLGSKDRVRRLYRVVPELRRRVRFERLNLMDADFGVQKQMDIIFCRNVIIYFDKVTQEKLLKKFCASLAPRGYIFMGHSETLLGMDVPLEQVRPTIYRKKK